MKWKTRKYENDTDKDREKEGKRKIGVFRIQTDY